MLLTNRPIDKHCRKHILLVGDNDTEYELLSLYTISESDALGNTKNVEIIDLQETLKVVKD